jgi:hypothetical protein
MIKWVPHTALVGWNVYYEVHIKELAFLVCMPIWLSNSTRYTIQISIPLAFASSTSRLVLSATFHNFLDVSPRDVTPGCMPDPLSCTNIMQKHMGYARHPRMQDQHHCSRKGGHYRPLDDSTQPFTMCRCHVSSLSAVLMRWLHCTNSKTYLHRISEAFDCKAT